MKKLSTVCRRMDCRLAAKWFGGRREPLASVAYEYSRDGRIAARTANGVRQEYAYDARGRLLSVREGGEEVERYAYDAAGNVLKKTVRGETTEYAYDGANQLVSSVCGGERTEYAYDAAGRLVREGGRTYRYGYLDKVLEVSENGRAYTYAYRPDGQLARADWGDGTAEDFVWDGLALARRGGEQLLNEPHAGGGSPVLSSSGTAYFSDILGTTLGGKAKGRKYAAARQTAFGEGDAAYFTGKPAVAGLGRVFFFRNYRPDLAKWQTADPTDYCDGFNQFSYCRNSPVTAFDAYSLWTVQLGIYGFAGASAGGTVSLGIALGFSWSDGFTCGFYYNGGAGSEIGAGGSAGIVIQISNSKNVAELAGQAISVGASCGEIVVFGFEMVIPLNIGETGYWGFDFSVGVGGGTPLEGHAIYNYTGFFKVYE